ncbi:MAG: PqqD family protein [Clostridia bacterium]|nr:PqqD family protein [Clostridia bacterium]
MKKKNRIDENYLERIPTRHSAITWEFDKNGMVTLAIENTGWANRIAQKLFKRPKYSYVHMDEMGTFVWPLLNGEQTITELGKQVKEHFGDKAEPLYPRLAKYIQILDSYHFIEWKQQ